MTKGRVVCHRADCHRSKARTAIFLPVLLGTIWTVITLVRTGCRLFVRNDTGAVSHYNDVIMTTMASQITSLTVVYSNVYSDAYQRKHQSSASLAFVWGINRDRWIPRTKGQFRGKCFHLMTSSSSTKESFVLTCSSVCSDSPFGNELHLRILWPALKVW